MDENEGYLEQDVLSLTDENGREREYELAGTLENGGREYYALIPTFDNPAELLEDAADLVILRVSSRRPTDRGEDSYLEEIPDDDEYRRVADLFEEQLGDRFEFCGDPDDPDAAPD